MVKVSVRFRGLGLGFNPNLLILAEAKFDKAEEINCPRRSNIRPASQR